jgi:hypothetical protein
MPQNVAYGRGFLDGRARAFRRGSMALAHVAGAIGLARRCGVSDDEIDTVLREFDLTLDRATGAPVAKVATFALRATAPKKDPGLPPGPALRPEA